MPQQTLLRPPQQVPPQKAEPRTQRSTPGHRKPQTGTASRIRAPRKGHWAWPVMGLVVAFILSLFAGVLLALHGPSQSSSAPGGPPLTLTPEGPKAPGPAEAREPRIAEEAGPVYGPKVPEPARGAAKKTPAALGKVLLRPGDTLYELAGTHATTVKALQQLNSLGTSTLIYAGKTLRLPTTTGQAHRTQSGPSAKPALSGAAPHTKQAPQAHKKTTAAKTPNRTAAKSGPGAVIAFARAQLGKPYIWGGTGSRGYDCSGLVMRAWQAAGVHLPRTTWSQVHAGQSTTRARLVPGDLVITSGGGHVQLYIGDNTVIHAPRPGSTITLAPLTQASQVVSYRHIS